MKAGFTQSYQVGFRFDKGASFLDMRARRLALGVGEPQAQHQADAHRRRGRPRARCSITCRAVVQTVDDRTGIPFEIDAVDGRLSQYGPKIIMGFCGKNLEGADQLLQEGDRDKTERGQKMRKQGLAIIDSLIRLVPMSPSRRRGLQHPDRTSLSPPTSCPGSRSACRRKTCAVLVNTYRREKKRRTRPPGMAQMGHRLLRLAPDAAGDGRVVPRGLAGRDGTGDPGRENHQLRPRAGAGAAERGDGAEEVLDSATKAAEYIWTNFGSKGVYLGATGTGNNIADKESGMLSMEAFLALYDNTKDPKWLERAEAAANYTESWIWIWNVPMPLDADDAKLHWKKGVPTIGVNGIGSDVAGGVDQYLDWAVPSYAKLYKLTKDEHYLDVALRAPARHQGHAGAARAHVRPAGPRLAAGTLEHGTGPQRHGRPPELAAVDFRQPPARHHRPGRVRHGSVSTTVQTGVNEHD